jgi:hypothetical protein
MPLVPGVRPVLEIGGRLFTNLTTLKIIHGWTNANNYTTLRACNATAGYQVTVSKSLYVYAMRITVLTAGASTGFYALYGDTDVGLNSVAAPTTPVYSGGSTSQYIGSGAAVGTSEVNSDFFIAAQKYPCFHADVSSVAFFYGYEQ